MWPAMDENLVFRADVMNGMAVMRAKHMAAAIRPYSMAVAPDSSLRNLFIVKLQSLLTAPAHVQHSALCLMSREHELKVQRTN